MDNLARDYTADIARISAPSPSFRLFRYDERKIMTWANHLKDDPLYVEDDARNYPNIMALIRWLLVGDCMNIVYDICDGGGVMTFSVIIPGHKCKVDWYMWDKSIWGKSFARESKGLVDFIMKEFNLHRAWSNTAKPEIVKFTKCFGATVEGVKRRDFKFDGKLYDTFMLGYETGKEE
jgi:RimJ/RimL family protein N-acetyltransferase